MGLLSHQVTREDLQPGDHVYSWRYAYSYAHHGIYIGDDTVIHFTRGQGEEIGTGTFLDKMFSSSLSPSQNSSPCEKCGESSDSSGVVMTCLDCFLCGRPLCRFQYNENTWTFLAKARGGTCTLAVSDPPETVLHRALHLLAYGFGCYHIFHNNCEDFAVYCKTGLLVMERKRIGRSGQAASILGIPVAAFVSAPLWLIMPQAAWGATAAMYCLTRYSADIGVRKDAVKISVEDLVIPLDPSLPVLQVESEHESVNGLDPSLPMLQLESQHESVNGNGLEDLVVELDPSLPLLQAESQHENER